MSDDADQLHRSKTMPHRLRIPSLTQNPRLSTSSSEDIEAKTVNPSLDFDISLSYLVEEVQLHTMGFVDARLLFLALDIESEPEREQMRKQELVDALKNLENTKQVTKTHRLFTIWACFLAFPVTIVLMTFQKCTGHNLYPISTLVHSLSPKVLKRISKRPIGLTAVNLFHVILVYAVAFGSVYPLIRYIYGTDVVTLNEAIIPLVLSGFMSVVAAFCVNAKTEAIRLGVAAFLEAEQLKKCQIETRHMHKNRPTYSRNSTSSSFSGVEIEQIGSSPAQSTPPNLLEIRPLTYFRDRAGSTFSLDPIHSQPTSSSNSVEIPSFSSTLTIYNVTSILNNTLKSLSATKMTRFFSFAWYIGRYLLVAFQALLGVILRLFFKIEFKDPIAIVCVVIVHAVVPLTTLRILEAGYLGFRGQRKRWRLFEELISSYHEHSAILPHIPLSTPTNVVSWLRLQRYMLHTTKSSTKSSTTLSGITLGGTLLLFLALLIDLVVLMPNREDPISRLSLNMFICLVIIYCCVIGGYTLAGLHYAAKVNTIQQRTIAKIKDIQLENEIRCVQLECPQTVLVSESDTASAATPVSPPVVLEPPASPPVSALNRGVKDKVCIRIEEMRAANRVLSHVVEAFREEMARIQVFGVALSPFMIRLFGALVISSCSMAYYLVPGIGS